MSSTLRLGRRAARTILLVASTAVAASPVPAQQEQSSPRPSPPRASPSQLSSVTGRVLLASPGVEPQPLAGVWVALNRVGIDSAGVMDSVRSDDGGTYTFDFRRIDDPGTIYFTDVTYAGVGYFTDPLRSLDVAGEQADLIVFDTLSRAPGEPQLLRVRGRHLVVGPDATGGRRAIVEVFEITNDTSFTLVPASDSQPVWSAALIPGAEDAAVGDGDVSANVVHFRNGRAEVYAPIAPGLRQLSVSYTIPARAFPLTVALTDAHELLEVLVGGDDGSASGAGLHAEEPVTIEGQPYRRFVSQRAAVGDAVVVRIAGDPLVRILAPAGIVATVLILAGALVYARRTRYPSVHN